MSFTRKNDYNWSQTVLLLVFKISDVKHKNFGQKNIMFLGLMYGNSRCGKLWCAFPQPLIGNMGCTKHPTALNVGIFFSLV